MSLIERPYSFSYSKNDIRYVWNLFDLTRPGLFLQVRLLYKALSDTDFTELDTFDLKQDSNGYVYFYIQNYLDSIVNYVLPVYNQQATSADEQARKFYIEFREITDADTDPDWITTESDHVLTVIKGGIEKNKFDKNNVFVNYLETQKPFLTWQPAGHFVFYSENVFLSFINPSPGTAIRIYIACKAVATGIQYFVFDFDGAATLYHINVGPAFLFANNLFSTGNMYYYEISITNADSTVTLINPYRFYLEYRPVYGPIYDLIYLNSLGGIDNVRVIGETDVTVNRDYDETEGGIKLNWNDPVHAYESSYTNIRMQRQYHGDIGYLRNRSKKQQEAFIEQLTSSCIYQFIDTRWIPVVNLQKSVDLGTNKETKQSFPIEWSLSESNEVFTPADKTFGAGVSTSICYPVTISGELPLGYVGTAYSASLTVTGGSLPINSITCDDKPGWLTIAYNPVTEQIDFTGTPDAEFTGTLTLTITNCTSVDIDTVLEIDTPDEGTEGTHFSTATDTGGDEWDQHEDITIIGAADEEIIVTVDNYTNNNGGTLSFNGTNITTIGQTISLTLDGTGNSAVIHVIITGNHAGPHPSVILGKFTITTASGGTIGSPASFTISKVY